MDPLVERINELYKKAKEEGLSTDEKEEQSRLRREYVDRVKNNLINTLDNTVIVDEDGNRTPLSRKTKGSKELERIFRTLD